VTVEDLPHLNGLLNGIGSGLLVAGFILIRLKRVGAHKACMIGAAAMSTSFLISYLVYHLNVGFITFEGSGLVRTAYLVVLSTHMALAITLPVIVPLTFRFALRGETDRHRRLARWTLPIWLYVSVTGVVIYFLAHGQA